MGIIRKEKEITKEQYQNAQLHNGFIAEEDMEKIFNCGELYGYGIYSAVACALPDESTNETKYVVSYTTGTTCD